MITSSLGYSLSGRQHSEFLIEELDSTLVSIPIDNLKNANGIIYYYIGKVYSLDSLSIEKDKRHLDMVSAVDQCNLEVGAVKSRNQNLLSINENLTTVNKTYKTTNRIAYGIIIALITVIVAK